MKKIVTGIILSVCFNVYSQFDVFIPTKVHLQIDKDDISGNVGNITETEYTVDNDDLPRDIFKLLKADTTGKQFENSKIQQRFEKQSGHCVRYDSSGRISAIEEYDAKGKLGDKTEYKYKPNGKISAKIEYDEGKFDGITKYEYDSNDSLKSETVYNEKNEMEDKNEMIRDGKGNIVQELDYDDDNTVERRTLYLQYDNKNNWHLKVTQSFDDDGSMILVKRTINY